MGNRIVFRFGFGQNYASLLAFRLCLFSAIRPKHFFGQKRHFWPKIHVLAHILMKILWNFRPKWTFLAKKPVFGPKKCFGRNFGSAEISAILVVLVSVSEFRLKFCFVCPLGTSGSSPSTSRRMRRGQASRSWRPEPPPCSAWAIPSCSPDSGLPLRTLCT